MRDWRFLLQRRPPLTCNNRYHASTSTLAPHHSHAPHLHTHAHLPTATMSDYGGDDGGFGDDGYEYVHGLSCAPLRCAAQLTSGAQREQMTQTHTLARADTRQWRGHRLR